MQMDGIIYWLKQEGAGHVFFMAYPICLLLSFALLKGGRVRFLVPCLLITAVIVNPLFYYIGDRGVYGYWRFLWTVPVIPVVASVVPGVSEKCHRPWLKGAAALAGMVLIIMGGSFLYLQETQSFTVSADNLLKLPKPVMSVADKLLTLKENPRIIAEPGISVYIRQYTGEIETMFGRNIFGYMDGYGQEAQMIIGDLENPDGDLSLTGQYMLDQGYDYLVVNEQQYKDRIKGKFDLVERVGAYGIYRALGTPRVITERDELGQILSVTTVDRDGKPENCEYGYSTVQYQYDNNGNIKEAKYRNVTGDYVTDADGVLTDQKTYDRKSQLVSQSCIYDDGTVLKQAFTKGKPVRTDYLDADGNPAKQPAGYYSFVQEWDGDRRVSRIYLDQNGSPVNRTDGYAQIRWVDDTAVFYNAEGKTVPLKGINLYNERKTDAEGWTGWIIPQRDTINWCCGWSSVNLGEKETGDSYSCQVEIEFKDVSSSDQQWFLFRTQGTVDGAWNVGNIWNDTICLNEAPADGIYRFACTKVLDEAMSKAGYFEIGFRCDNWKSGSFRVRKIKIEKGPSPTDWTPGI